MMLAHGPVLDDWLAKRLDRRFRLPGNAGDFVRRCSLRLRPGGHRPGAPGRSQGTDECGAPALLSSLWLGRSVGRQFSTRCCTRLAGAAQPRVFVVHLSHVEVHRSARRHGVPDEDIEHALGHSVAWAELGDDPPRYLVVGPDRSGNLLELVVLHTQGDELVIHAMALRRTTQREMFGGEP